MIRVVILTSVRRGTASYCLDLLRKEKEIEIVQVIFSEGKNKNRIHHLKKKWRKVLKIGILGALNGIRIRSWFAGGPLKQNLSDIEALCRENSIPFFITPYIAHSDTVRFMKESGADVGLSLGNSYISEKIFSIPKFGMLNIHGEILPEFQNAQSVIWQIYEGSMNTGYTIHKIDRKIDTGAILKREEYPILFQKSFEQTVRKTIDETLIRSAGGLIEVLLNFEYFNNTARNQGMGRSYTTPSIKEFIIMKKNFRVLKCRYFSNKN